MILNLLVYVHTVLTSAWRSPGDKASLTEEIWLLRHKHCPWTLYIFPPSESRLPVLLAKFLSNSHSLCAWSGFCSYSSWGNGNSTSLDDSTLSSSGLWFHCLYLCPSNTLLGRKIHPRAVSILFQMRSRRVLKELEKSRPYLSKLLVFMLNTYWILECRKYLLLEKN